MRIRILLIAILFFQNCKSDTNNKPIMFVKNKDRNLGTIPFKSSSIITYSIYNIGQKDLLIDTVSVSCGCTVPNFYKTLIKPGDSINLSINYTPVSVGDFFKSVVVKSNIDSVFTILKFSGTTKD